MYFFSTLLMMANIKTIPMTFELNAAVRTRDKKWDDKISWFRDFFVYNIIKLPWKLQLYCSWNISKDIALLDIKFCAPIMSQPSVDHPHVSWRPIRLVIQHCMDHPLTPRPILMIEPSNQYHIKDIVNFFITKIYITSLW